MPESPKWLLSVGRVAEAEKIVRTAAKCNNIKLPEGNMRIVSIEDFT